MRTPLLRAGMYPSKSGHPGESADLAPQERQGNREISRRKCLDHLIALTAPNQGLSSEPGNAQSKHRMLYAVIDAVQTWHGTSQDSIPGHRPLTTEKSNNQLSIPCLACDSGFGVGYRPKAGSERLVALNTVATSVFEEQRGSDAGFVCTRPWRIREHHLKNIVQTVFLSKGHPWRSSRRHRLTSHSIANFRMLFFYLPVPARHLNVQPPRDPLRAMHNRPPTPSQSCLQHDMLRSCEFFPSPVQSLPRASPARPSRLRHAPQNLRKHEMLVRRSPPGMER